MKLNARFLKDVSASTEGECLEKCYANAKCEGVSFKKSGGCWLRQDVKGFMVDSSKSSYILCEGERGAHPSIALCCCAAVCLDMPYTWSSPYPDFDMIHMQLL